MWWTLGFRIQPLSSSEVAFHDYVPKENTNRLVWYCMCSLRLVTDFLDTADITFCSDIKEINRSLARLTQAQELAISLQWSLQRWVKEAKTRHLPKSQKVCSPWMGQPEALLQGRSCTPCPNGSLFTNTPYRLPNHDLFLYLPTDTDFLSVCYSEHKSEQSQGCKPSSSWEDFQPLLLE